jgi:hypothetical protein
MNVKLKIKDVQHIIKHGNTRNAYIILVVETQHHTLHINPEYQRLTDCHKSLDRNNTNSLNIISIKYTSDSFQCQMYTVAMY